MARSITDGTQCEESDMSEDFYAFDKESYRNERIKFYFKAIDLVAKEDEGLELDDIYENAALEASKMWAVFSASLHPVFEDEIRITERLGGKTPTDWDRYMAYHKCTVSYLR